MTANNPKVISIISDDGTHTQYKKVSARIPEFLKEYGPDKGFRVLSDISEFHDVSESRMAFLLALVEKGQLPNERIDEMLNDRKFIFRSQLLDKEGNVIAEAHAVKRIWREKDYETGETAALQRLMARVGFGGEVFDIDEINDMEDQNLNYQTGQAGGDSPVTVAPVSDIKQNQVQPTPENESEPEPKTSEAKAPEEPKKPAATTKAPANNDKSRSGGGKRAQVTKVQPAQLKQLASQARIKGVECPTVETIEEFQAELAKIRALPLPE